MRSVNVVQQDTLDRAARKAKARDMDDDNGTTIL